MKLFIFFICSFSMLHIKAQDFSYIPEKSSILQPKYGKDVIKQCSRADVLNAKSFWKVDEQSKNLLEQNFKKVLELEAVCCLVEGWKIKDLSKHAYQYMGIIIGGKKLIYISAYDIKDADMPEWKTRPIRVCDGGSSYWGVLFDVASTSFKELSINGGG
jgi:hypothetical protein